MILASTSPRRRELVRKLGIAVTIAEPSGEERTDGTAEEIALTNARIKALSVSAADIVLGADTVVSLDGAILLKPSDAAEARRMLRALSGKSHIVVTGVCLTDGKTTVCACETTPVEFGLLPESLIERYVAAGLSFGKAGAYGLQDRELAGYATARGDKDNVIGLPVRLVSKLLKEHFHVGTGNCH